MSQSASLNAVLCMLLAATNLHAAPRAWLQPNRIALGETTTLNVESDSATAQAPDFSGLQRDFDLRGQSSSSRMTIVNWHTEARTNYAVVLEPRATGVFRIPSLTVGGGRTEPISLTVMPATPGSAQRGDAIYFESELATRDPYVQQAIPYTVRLYYAVSLVDGGVEVGAPDNASLQQIGEDRTSEQDIGGRRYAVFERHYLLTPDKSGPMSLPPPHFRGRARSNDGNGLFGNVVSVSQVGAAELLNVRPQPANAPTPWLVANQLTLTHGDVAHEVRAGEPLMLELKLTAEGAMASQLPELHLASIPGAHVFPEPQQSNDAMVDGRPKATVTRRFAVVAALPGTLRLPEVRVNYWNATTDRADAETVPAMSVRVTPGAAVPLNASPPTSPVQTPAGRNYAAVSSSAATADTRTLRLWQALTSGLALGFALALVWGWRRGRSRTPTKVGPEESGVQTASVSHVALQRALASGDLRLIAAALRATTSPPSPTLGFLNSQLADPEQQSAIEALERSLWAAGDSADQPTCQRLRHVFRNGPRFVPGHSALNKEALLPLYPQRST